jgi:hypothetical protein
MTAVKINSTLDHAARRTTDMATQKYMGRFQIIDRLAAQVGDRAKALKILEGYGYVKPGTEELTAEGLKRNAMTAEERAKDRAAKRTGRKHTDFKYDPSTNRATLKGK